MQPRLYKLKLFLLLLVGYCSIFLPVAIFSALIYLLLWTIVTGNGLSGPVILIEVVLVIFAARFVKALWVKHPRSEGIALDEKQTPKLFETIREIREALHGQSIHKVVLTEQFEILLTSVPRLGLLGWSRNHLDVGLPLLLALSPIQFRSLLAHELGHQSGTRFGSLVYRNRELWPQLAWQVEQRGGLESWIFTRFFLRYARFFREYSLAFARSREFEADHRAAEIATSEVLADALIRYEYGQALFYQCSDDFDEEYSNEIPPPAGFAETFRKALQSELQNERALRAIEYALGDKAHPYNPHPALKDRLQALGQQARLPTLVFESAADVYLGDVLTQLINEQNRAWEKRSERYWRYDQKSAQSSSPASESLKRAYEAESNGDTEAALLSYREALQVDGELATAHLGIGRILLRENNADGIHYLERAMELDMRNVPQSCSLIMTYLTKTGDAVRAAPYQRRMTEFSRFSSNSDTERSLVSFVDRFMSHDLPESEVEQLRQELAKHARIREAYLVRKEVQYFPEKPLYVLGLVFERSWFAGSTEDLSFARRFPRAVTMPIELYTFVLDDRNRRVRKIFRNLNNSQII